jgi:ABC-type polysaccharide/polyol phosphate transport system ATPase subunit
MAIVEARDIVKTYRIGVGRARVREMLPWPVDVGVRRLFPRWWTKDTFNALDGVSVAVEQGESLGIVGHNGAGKTTLLKVIAGVTAPTAGQVRSQGRMGALIDLLVGFHPDLTGGENAYLLGSILGLNRRQMSPRIGRILEFAEIEEMADTPVKRYSAGMQARLGFATLVAIEPEILLIDEVLAVGDATFQRKCVKWLDEYRRNGGTLLFVSHNLGLVRSMTDRAVWLDHGQVAGEGPTGKLLSEYARAMERRTEAVSELGRNRGRAKRAMESRGMHRWGAGGARLEAVGIHDPDEGGELEITITYENTELERAIFCVGFVDESGQEVGVAASPNLPLAGERGTVRCAIRPAPFRSGIYFPVAAILSPGGRVEDRWRLDRAIVVDRDGTSAMIGDFGPVEIASSWSGG